MLMQSTRSLIMEAAPVVGSQGTENDCGTEPRVSMTDEDVMVDPRKLLVCGPVQEVSAGSNVNRVPSVSLQVILMLATTEEYGCNVLLPPLMIVDTGTHSPEGMTIDCMGRTRTGDIYAPVHPELPLLQVTVDCGVAVQHPLLHTPTDPKFQNRQLGFVQHQLLQDDAVCIGLFPVGPTHLVPDIKGRVEFSSQP